MESDDLGVVIGSQLMLERTPLNPGDDTIDGDLDSEGEVSSDLIAISSSDSLTNLAIPPIPKSGSTLSLAQDLADHAQWSATPSPSDSRVPSRYHTPALEEEEYTLPLDGIDPTLEALLSPHHHHRPGQAPKVRLVSSSSNLTVAPTQQTVVTDMVSSTPAKGRRSRRNSHRLSIPKDVMGSSGSASSSGTESPSRTGPAMRKDARGDFLPSPSLSSSSSNQLSPLEGPLPRRDSTAAERNLFGERPTTLRRSITSDQVALQSRPGVSELSSIDRVPPSLGAKRNPRLNVFTGAPARSVSAQSAAGEESSSARTEGWGGCATPPHTRSSTQSSPQYSPQQRLRPRDLPTFSGASLPRSYSALGTSSSRRPGVEGLFKDQNYSPSERRRQSIDDGRNVPGDYALTDGGLPGGGDILGPRTYRAFQAAGLIDRKPRGMEEQDTHGFERPPRRPFTATGFTSRPGRESPSHSLESSYNLPAWKKLVIDRPLAPAHDITGSYRGHHRFGSEQESIKSGLTRSSSDRFAPDHPTLGHQYKPPSPTVSSSRTLISSSASSAPYSSSVHGLRERHELERDALLAALAESKHTTNELREENEALRDRNQELERYIAQLEHRLAAYERRILREAVDHDRTPSPYRSASARRACGVELTVPSASRSALGRDANPDSHYPSPRLRNPPGRATLFRAQDSETNTDVGGNAAFSPSRMTRHRHTFSDTSSILHQVPGAMSMLMNERNPIGDSAAGSSNEEEADDIDDINNHRDESEDTHKLAVPANYTFTPTTKQPQSRAISDHLGTPVSPTDSSFAMTSITDSPGSLMLRREDELHLNEFISLRDDSD